MSRYDCIILIAVRLKSHRLPKKALSIIEDQTLIEHLIDRMKLVKNSQKIILCTSTNPQDTPLEEIANKKDIECFRGSEDNVIDRFIKAVEKYNPKHIVRTTGDNCLVSFEFLDYAILKHEENKVDYTTTEQLPRGGKAEVISFKTLKRLEKIAEDPNASEYMTWLLDQPEYFNVQKLDVPEDLKRPNYRITCDTKDDLSLIRAIHKRLYKGNPIRLREVIELLDNSDLTLINQHIDQKSKTDLSHLNLNLKDLK